MQGPNSNFSIPNDKTVHWDNGLCIYKNMYIRDIWNCYFLNSNLFHVLDMVACIKQATERKLCMRAEYKVPPNKEDQHDICFSVWILV